MIKTNLVGQLVRRAVRAKDKVNLVPSDESYEVVAVYLPTDHRELSAVLAEVDKFGNRVSGVRFIDEFVSALISR